DNRSRIERQKLAEQQTADYRYPERPSELRPDAGSKRKRQTPKKRRHRGHHDRSEPEQTRLVDRGFGCLAVLAFGLERKVDHHDRVLLHDSNQQNNPDEPYDVEFGAADHQRQNRADTRRRQRRENGQRMDVALIQDSENYVHRDYRGKNQQRLVCERSLKRLRRALKRRLDRRGQTDLGLCSFNRLDRLPKSGSRSQIERQRDRRKLALMVHRQTGSLRLEMSEGAQRNLRPV